MNAYFQGAAGSVGYPDEGPPAKLEKEIARLESFPTNYVVRKTISPVAPPSPFVALEFIGTVSSYVTESRALGWITNQPVADRYREHFITAQTALRKKDINAARISLNTVLTEVAQNSGKVLTSEAFALLRYNTEYLLNQLPGRALSLCSPITASRSNI